MVTGWLITRCQCQVVARKCSIWRTSESTGTCVFALPLRATPPGARTNPPMLQTTTNALNARSLFRKYYPPVGNRTAHRRYGCACEAAPTLVVLVFRGVLNATRRKKLGTNVRACNAVSRFRLPGIPNKKEDVQWQPGSGSS